MKDDGDRRTPSPHLIIFLRGCLHVICKEFTCAFYKLGEHRYSVSGSLDSLTICHAL